MIEGHLHVSGNPHDDIIKALLHSPASMIEIRKGDLIKAAQEENHPDVIVHGCNCFCTMGAGIAKQIASVFPEAYNADKATIPGDRSKLGKYTKYTYANGLTVVNAYTQYAYGRGGRHFDYFAFERLIKQFNTDFPNLTVAMPWIGCGLAGGDKRKVFDILEKNVKYFKCIIYEV